MAIGTPITTKPATGELTAYPRALDTLPYLADSAPNDHIQTYINSLVDAVNAMQTRMGVSGATGRFVSGTATLTSAAAATAVNVITDAQVGTGYTFYPLGFLCRVNGTTVWATTANVKIQDTNGTPVDFATILVALLTSQARVGDEPKANLTLENAMANGTGGTSGKGVQIVGDANGTGSDLIVTVWGIVK